MRESVAQASDDFLHRRVALAKRFETDEHAAGIALSSAGDANYAFHGRIAAYDVHERHELFLHRLERRVLIRLNAAHQSTGVLFGKKPLWNLHEEIHVETHHGQQHDHDDLTVIERPAQRAFVTALHRGVSPLAPLRQATRLSLPNRAQ